MQPIAAQVISKQVSTSHPPYIPYFIKEKEWNKTRPIWTRNADDGSTMSTLGKSQGEMGLQLIVFRSKNMVTLVNFSLGIPKEKEEWNATGGRKLRSL